MDGHIGGGGGGGGNFSCPTAKLHLRDVSSFSDIVICSVLSACIVHVCMSSHVNY